MKGGPIPRQRQLRSVAGLTPSRRAACSSFSMSYALSPANQFVDVNGGSATIQVTTESGCAWTVNVSNYPVPQPWLTLTSSSGSGSGSGTITVNVSPNTTGATQIGSVTVANQNVAITQPGTSCSYVLGQTQINAPASGASGSISVSTACPIVASSDASWVTVIAIGPSVAYYIALNMSTSPQSATITIGDQTVSVSEAAETPAYSMAATSLTLAPGGSGASTVTVSSNNDYSGTVSFTCSITSSPVGASDIPTCTASQTVTLSSTTTSGTASVTVNTTAASSGALARPKLGRSKGWGGAGGTVLALLIFLWTPRQRRHWRSMFGILVLLAVFGGLGGCGGGGGSGGSGTTQSTNPGTTAGSYTITVTGTGNDSAKTMETATFTLTVN